MNGLKIRGLYYITHIKNLPSILEKGILSHSKVISENISFTPIYDEGIVTNRRDRKAPNGRILWEFANLYFQPRNAMLYRILLSSDISPSDIVIIGLKLNEILKREDIYVTDGNAASPYTKFFSSKEINKHIGAILKQTDREWWSDVDSSKRKIMAECLVPDKVGPECISEIYVPTKTVLDKVRSICGEKIPVIFEPRLFFLPSRQIKLTGTLTLVEGDMFFSRMQTLTISVNTVGVMGKGLASRAKYQFPDVYVKYQYLCRKKILKLGKPYLYKREKSLDYELADDVSSLSNLNSHTWFLLFPTKNHWREMSDIEGIKKGLEWLITNYKKEGIKSLAIPALGCGLGGLQWSNMGPILCSYLKKLDIPVNLYLPLEQKIPDDQLSKEFLLGKGV